MRMTNVKGQSQSTPYVPGSAPRMWQVGHSPLLLRDFVHSCRQPITHTISLKLRERLPRAVRILLVILFILIILAL